MDDALKLIWLKELVGESDLVYKDERMNLAFNADWNTVVYVDKALTEEVASFLEKILAACKIDKSQYAVFEEPFSIVQVKDALPNLQHVFLFGVAPSRIGLNIKPFTCDRLNIDNKTIVIYASLTEIIANNEMKGTLWNDLLKPVFAK